MRFLIQRVKEASVLVKHEVVGKIDKGFLVFVGIQNEDTREIADKMIRKMINLRIFEDENGKTNLNIDSVDGEMLIISQFTLYADCKHGNRPSFIQAGTPDYANELYEYIIEQCEKTNIPTQKGIFGADMKVSLVNDGPFTILLDSDELF